MSSLLLVHYALMFVIVVRYMLLFLVCCVFVIDRCRFVVSLLFVVRCVYVVVVVVVCRG